MNPDQSSTKLVAPDNSKTKMAKIKVIKPIRIDGTIYEIGKELEVPEAVAKEFCDQKIEGHYAFVGARHIDDGDVKRHSGYRAVRV